LFSLVIALGFIGFSVFGEVRSIFRGFGFAWPLAWLISVLLVRYLAKNESRIKQEAKFKLYLSLSVIGFGILSSYILGAYENALFDSIPKYDLDTSPTSINKRNIGPRGK